MGKISLRDALADTENPATSLALYLVEAPPEKDELIDDEWVRWPSVAKLALRKYGDLAIYQEAQDDAEHRIVLRDARQTLSDRLREAQIAVTSTSKALAELVADHVCDVEFAEGSAGGDIQTLLDQVARDLRCVRAIFTVASG